MSESEFDVIVVGAGLAGLCCAGELILQGANPLLISETKEVGAVFRPKWVGENRGFVQHPMSVVAWGGGWWYSLIRRLNVPVRMYPGMGFEIGIVGGGPAGIHEVPVCASGSAMTDFLIRAAPFPIEEIRGDFEKVMDAAFNIPYEELLKMDRVPMGEWLEDQKISDFAAHVVLMLGCVTAGSTIDETRDHTSVLGVFGYLRTILCGEATFPVIYPDAREGLCVPIAKAIEARGGTVWRGRRVEKVNIEGDRVRGVVMADGTEVSAPAVAIATGNPRIRALLGDNVPPEAEAPLTFSDSHAYQDYCTYAVLDKPIVSPERKNWLSLLDATGSFVQVSWALHACAPWSTEPGKQFVLTQAVGPKSSYADQGGEDAIYARIHDVNDEFFPGYKDAISEVATDRHSHFWFSESGTGPKLERTSESVDGLFFAGDGTAPIVGVAADAASGAGVLGARAIMAKRKG